MIDNSQIILGAITIFSFVSDLSLMIHEFLFILLSNEIRFPFSFWLMEIDAISFQKLESFLKLTLISGLVFLCDVI